LAVEINRAPAQPDLEPQIAHLLLIDVVGYSKLLVNEQIELLQELNHAVRATDCFRAAEAKEKLIRIPTGDGMALLFFENPEEPVRCALEIAAALKTRSPEIRVRMGIHSGPVNQVTDVNDRVNIAGSGINIAQRVLDCGDAGHILVSKHVADDLMQYRQWHPHLQDLGECEVKHGLRLHVFNLCKDGVGNPQLPARLAPGKRGQRDAAALRPASSLRSATPWMVAAFGAAALVVTMSILWPRLFVRHNAAAVAEGALALPEKSIAVLPFENFSDDQQNIYFASGVQDEILTNLAKVADLKVISRTSTLQYKSGGNARRNVREIANQLGVANIVEGTVQRVGDHVRVSAQLIDARTDTHLWAEHYDRDMADVFAVESEVAQKIAATLRVKLSPGEKAAMEEPPTNDLIAYDLYAHAKELIAGNFYRPQGKEDLVEAVRLLDRATGRDSKFLLAFYELARAHGLLYVFGLDHSPARLEMAHQAVEAALRLRPDSAEAHLAQAQHLYWGYRDYSRAREELAIAQRALPNEPLTFVLAGYIARRQGRFDEAIEHFKRAADLDPRNVGTLQQLFLTYELLSRAKESAAIMDRILTITPDDPLEQMNRAYVDLECCADPRPLHRVIDAITAAGTADTERLVSTQRVRLAFCERDAAAFDRAMKALPEDGCRYLGVPFPKSWCEGWASRLGGNAAAAHDAFMRARAQIEKIVRDQPDYAEGLIALGMIDAALGNKKDAINEGRRAVQLCPINKDAIAGNLMLQYLAIIYASTGEKELAIKELTHSVRMAGSASYGELRLHPYWDPLRGNREFEKIVTSLAPDASHP